MTKERLYRKGILRGHDGILSQGYYTLNGHGVLSYARGH